jgi:hypothetical protein
MALANTDGELVACNDRFRKLSGLKHLPNALGLDFSSSATSAAGSKEGGEGKSTKKDSGSSTNGESTKRTTAATGASSSSSGNNSKNTATSMFALFLPESLQGAYAWMAKASATLGGKHDDVEYIARAVGADRKKPLRLALSAVRDEKNHPSIFHLALLEDH